MRSAVARRASLPEGALTSMAALLALCLALLSGCGAGSSASTSRHATAAAKPALPPVCRPAARQAIARSTAVSVGSVSAVAGVGNNGQPECRFAFAAPPRHVRVVANLDGAPQAYFRLERTIVETAQLFRAQRTFPAPEQVQGVGLDASWFPTDSDFMTTDGRTLITVGVHWPGVPQRRMATLAAAVAKQYLGPLDWKAADPPGSGT